MEDETGSANLRDRLARSGEDALGKLAQDLLENPLVTGAISRAFEAREKATAAQETAMSALNLPSAADLERLTRRLRSVSQRLEGIEDGVDRLDRRFEEAAKSAPPEERLARDRVPAREALRRRGAARRRAGRRARAAAPRAGAAGGRQARARAEAVVGEEVVVGTSRRLGRDRADSRGRCDRRRL